MHYHVGSNHFHVCFKQWWTYCNSITLIVKRWFSCHIVKTPLVITLVITSFRIYATRKTKLSNKVIDSCSPLVLKHLKCWSEWTYCRIWSLFSWGMPVQGINALFNNSRHSFFTVHALLREVSVSSNTVSSPHPPTASINPRAVAAWFIEELVPNPLS